MALAREANRVNLVGVVLRGTPVTIFALVRGAAPRMESLALLRILDLLEPDLSKGRSILNGRLLI